MDQLGPELWAAADVGHVDEVRALSRRGANSNEIHEETQTSPLWIAASKGHLEVCMFLVEKRDGAHVDDMCAPSFEESGLRKSPLGVAARAGHSAVVKYLLGQGADPNLRDGAGVAALHYACDGGHVGTVKTLTDHDGTNFDIHRATDGATPLGIAARRGYLTIVSHFCDLAAAAKDSLDGEVCLDIDLPSFGGASPFMLAAAHGNLRCCTLLGSHADDVDLNRQDNDGHNALFHASVNGHDQVCRYLGGRGIAAFTGRMAAELKRLRWSQIAM